MRLAWTSIIAFFIILTSAASNLGLAPAGPEQKQQDVAIRGHQDETPPEILPGLLNLIKIESSMINAILMRYQDAHDMPSRKTAKLVGRRFKRMTKAMSRAKLLLDQVTPEALDEADREGGCGRACMKDYTKVIIRQLSMTTRGAITKLGLMELGRYIQPAFLALSGIVLTVNTIIGGLLVFISTLVNGLLLAIAAGIGYLGHLATEQERVQAGGPNGPKTVEITELLEALEWAVTQ